MMMISEQEARALAKTIELMRPDWNFAGIVRAIGDARLKAHKWSVAHAALNAASNPDNRTPAIIALNGPHWPEIPREVTPRIAAIHGEKRTEEEIQECHRLYLAAKAVLNTHRIHKDESA